MKNNYVGLVVDAPYLYAAKEVLGGNVDYVKLYNKVSEFGEISHAVVHTKDMPGQRKFLAALKSTGYEVFSKNGDSESRWWIQEVAKSILMAAPHVSHLVVAVGDARLAPILEFAEMNWGCQITVMGFRDRTDEDILDIAGAGFVEVDTEYAYATRLTAELVGN